MLDGRVVSSGMLSRGSYDLTHLLVTSPAGSSIFSKLCFLFRKDYQSVDYGRVLDLLGSPEERKLSPVFELVYYSLAVAHSYLEISRRKVTRGSWGKF